MSDEANSQLNDQLKYAFDNPEEFDFGFVDEREEAGFANFGFDPDEAKRLQDAELNRIRDNEGFDYGKDELVLPSSSAVIDEFIRNSIQFG